MASVMSSQSTVILTTAMAVSGAVIFLSLCRTRNPPSTHHDSHHSQSSNPSLRSCLCSDGKRRDKNKKKRVKFADNIKEKWIETDYNYSGKKSKKDKIFIVDEKVPEFRRMPANRAALYHGILKDRVHRIECSY